MADGFICGCEIQKQPRQTNYSPYHKKISASFQVSKYLSLTLLWYKKQPLAAEAAAGCSCFVHVIILERRH